MTKPPPAKPKTIVLITVQYELTTGYEYSDVDPTDIKEVGAGGIVEKHSGYTRYPQLGTNDVIPVMLEIPNLSQAQTAGPANLALLRSYDEKVRKISHAINLAAYIHDQLLKNFDVDGVYTGGKRSSSKRGLRGQKKA